MDERHQNIPKKRVGILAAVVIVFFALIGGLVVYNTPENRLARQLDLGERYLEEQNYAEAILAFEKAIQIDDRCMAAYVNGIEAYRHLDEPENLLSFYEKALEAARSLEGEALTTDMEAVVSIYLAAEDVYTDRDALTTLWEEGYEKSGQDSRVQDNLVSVYLEQAEERASSGAYEESLQTYDRLLELDGQSEAVRESLSESLKSYMDHLMEEENFDRIRELEEKYAPLLPELNFESYIKGIGEKIFAVKLNEYKDMLQICENSFLKFGPDYYSFLTYTEKEKIYRPIAEELKEYIKLLLDYQNISERADELVNQHEYSGINHYMTIMYAYECLADVYLKLNEMDECLYCRSQYLALKGISLNENSYQVGAITYDQYGREIRYEMSETSFYTYEYNEKNQIVRNVNTYNTRSEIIKYMYSSDGRLIEEIQELADYGWHIEYDYPEEGVVTRICTITDSTWNGEKTHIEQWKINQYGIHIESE